MLMWRIAATSFGWSQQSVFCVFAPPPLVKNIAVHTPIRFYVWRAEPWQPCVGILKVKHTNGNSCKYLAYSASKNEHENVPVWNQFVDAEPHRLFFALTCWLPRQHCTLETNLSQTRPLIVFESMEVGEEPLVPEPPGPVAQSSTLREEQSAGDALMNWAALSQTKPTSLQLLSSQRPQICFPSHWFKPVLQRQTQLRVIVMISLAFLSEAAAKKTKILFPVQVDLNVSPGLQRETHSMFTKNCLCHWKSPPPFTAS